MKISWRWTCSQTFRKFRRLENLPLFWMMFWIMLLKYSFCSPLDFEYRFWVIICAQEIAPQQTITYLKSTIETLKERENYSKLTIETPEQLSTLLFINYGHNSLLFLLSCCWLWTSKCFLGPILSIYKRWNNILLQLLTDVQKSY